jgi:hypothetical protein
MKVLIRQNRIFTSEYPVAKFLADGIKAAAAGAPDKKLFVPLRNGYEEYTEAHILNIYLKASVPSALGAQNALSEIKFFLF